MQGALDGVTVLDLSQGAAGPTCAMHLGDLGAVVVKVEPPGGEWGRRLGPPFVGDVAAAFLGMNRNKRSIVIDLKQPDGADVVLRLAEASDIVLESFRPGVADRLGVGYDAISGCNPEVIYAAISAFGQSGPWRDRPGVDGVAQAMGGIMSVTGTPDGPPVKVGVPAADMAGGIFASQSILAALYARERTGSGQRVDVSLLDALLSYQVVPLSMYLASGTSPQRLGSAAPYAAPNEAYRTKDGHIMVAAYTPKRWTAFCKVLGVPDLARDDRFDTNEKRVIHRSALREIVEPYFAEQHTAEWVDALDQADVLCGPLLSYPELMAEEHITRGDSIVTVDHPATGKVRSPAFPGRLSQTPCDPTGSAPPIAGQHTNEILEEYGFAQPDIERLNESGTVIAAPQTQTHEERDQQ